MKTLAVLSALATLAVAAPAPEEYTRFSPSDFTITQQREKKSTQLETLPEKSPDHLEDHASERISNKFGPSNSVARTFSGFKKPIIVKKKIGYHLYRDSDEEQSQADPRENCRKQIKVKLCDDNNSMDKMKSASIDHTHDEISESEMEHSINMAKEAVETFQRDLQKMEHESAENINHRHTPLGSDMELHEDIEKARQALEHIHRKFKNLDPATANVDERASNIHSKTLKTEEERMAQWKEAGKLHKSDEKAKNLEDNFKSVNEKDVSKQLNLNNVDLNNLNDEEKAFKTTIEDIDTPSNTNVEDGVTSIVEDKVPKLKIQSDNLIKDNTANEGGQRKEEKLSHMEHQTKEQEETIEKNAEVNKHDNHNPGLQNTEDQAIEDKEIKLKSVDLHGHGLKMLEQLSRNNVDHNKMLKSNDDHSASDAHEQTKPEEELHKGHLHTKSIHENDQKTLESKHVNTILSTKSETTTSSEEAKVKNDGNTALNNWNKGQLDHENFEHRSMLPKSTESTSFSNNQEHLRNDDNIKGLHKEMELQRSTPIGAMPMKSETHNLKDEHGSNIDSLRLSSSSTTSSKFNNEKNSEKINHANNDVKKDQEMPGHRASSDFNKELLNNMEFVEDLHHMALHQPSPTEASHMLKTEHERLNVPLVQPNSEHLKTMMHFSDNSHHGSPQLKMASMFNNEQPNIDVQFNEPHNFQEQTNVQELMPFRSAGDIHNKHLHNMGFDEEEHMPTEFHDPLKTRWAHENHVDADRLKAAAQFHQENMKMDGSSQHFNVEKLTPSRGSLINDQHLSLNEQIRAQQRWAQAKNINTHQLSPMNAGLHAHESFVSRNNDHNLMMHEKSNIDGTRPSSFMQMRGAPKMALEYSNPNQWSHNHGAFRSSYGPGMSASYGSGAGSASSGSAVGVFPNANVGNCAVPLLLSCSPSVVSGSLAKAQTSQNAYSAPSYRSEDINFLKKRGIDINEMNPGLKLQRVTPLGQRQNVILEKNQ